MIPQRNPHNTNNYQPNYYSNQPQNQPQYQIPKQVQNNQQFISVNNQQMNYIPGNNQLQFVNLFYLKEDQIFYLGIFERFQSHTNILFQGGYNNHKDMGSLLLLT